MLTPVAVATWIAFCIPWADPVATAALVSAGSGGEPYLVTDAAGQRFVGKTLIEAAAHVKKQPPNAELYLGLAQVPLSALRQRGYLPDDALDKCGSLETGYEVLLSAYEQARNVEKTPWKILAAAFSYYRTRSFAIDTPFAKAATDFVLQNKAVAPAPISHEQYRDMVREWSAAFAQRLSHRATSLHANARQYAAVPAGAAQPGAATVR